MGGHMIKLKNLISEAHGIDVDRLMWNGSYLEDVAEQFEYNDDFNKLFWSQRYVPTLYHCTTEENYEQIKVEGLKKKSNTRGAISNRHIGPAIFTTQEEEVIGTFQRSYGPIVIAINTKAMKTDRFMPIVEMEPDWARAMMLSFVLQKIGYPDDKTDVSLFIDSSDQTSQYTVIIYSNIPVKYLSLVEYDT